jgi:type I restriction enzyme S subunit
MVDVRHSGTPDRSEGGELLPKGWCFSKIADVSLKASQRKPDDEELFVYVDIGSINRDFKIIESPQRLIGKDAPSRARKIIKQGDVLVSLTRPNLNAVAIVNGELDDQIASTGFEVIHPLLVDSRYIFALTKSKEFIESISGAVQGALYPAAKSSDVQAYCFPLPPLAEQKVIADKLDTLLAQVETTKARLDHIPNILKTFRQSVLAAAVSGKLTEEWRERHEISRSGWLSTKFSSICREITVGYVGKMADRYESSGIPFLRSQNVRAFQYSDVNLLYISKDFHKKIYKSRLEPGDLAIVRSGAPGTTCVIPASLGIANCSDLVIARPNEKLISDFGCIFMNSEIAQKNVSENQVGVAQQHFNVGSMKKMPIDLPSNKEQTEIVRRVEELFAFADSIEQKNNAALERVNNLTQSILAKAFRGELTADWRAANPELISGENSAEALLAKIQAEREAIKKQPKPKRNAVKKKTGSRMSKQIIKIVDALKEAKKPLNGQELLAASGYPSDSNIDQLEQFFLDIREALVTEKTIVKIKRDDDGEDWFALAESAINE